MAKKNKKKRKKRSVALKAVSETGSVPVSNPSYGSSLRASEFTTKAGARRVSETMDQFSSARTYWKFLESALTTECVGL